MTDSPDKSGICRELIDRYIRDNATPDHLVSSHWKELHAQVQVIETEGEIRTLKGLGFGHVDQMSLPARFFSWATIFLYLLILPERAALWQLMKTGRRLCRRIGIAFSHDCFRQLCSLNLLRTRSNRQGRFTFLVIGDGYGFLSCLVKELYPESRVVLIDLGKTLLFQAWNAQKAFPGARHVLVSSSRVNALENLENVDFVYCPAEETGLIEDRVKVHWAVNIASMQEMNADTVRGYFTLLRKVMVPDNLFYCCNREEKVMPGGEVARFYEFPWREEDEHLVEGPCPWHQFFLSARGTAQRPRLAGLPIPFVRSYDGNHLHRLSRLAVG